MRFIVFLILGIFVFQLVIAASSEVVNINFEVKDENGNPLPDTLIIIQGITNTGFSESKLTDSGGKASFTLNKNELFIYIVYKLSYKEQTGSFFTSGDKNIQITLQKLPDDQWFFYLLNNGEIEFSFKSLDDNTNYETGDYIKEILKIRNVAERNIKLVEDKSTFQTIDGQTMNALRAWGKFLDLSNDLPGLEEITLKRRGWIEATLSDGLVKICMSNLIVIYGGNTIELSGEEFLCVEEGRQYNKVPEWILKNKYRFKIDYFYEISGIEKQINFTSQEFFIDNIDWKPEIASLPETDLAIDEEWLYNIQLKEYDESFSNLLDMINYKLIEAPDGMTVDKDEGIIRWTPVQNGNYNVVVRAYHEYFENDPEKITYVDQEFVLEVGGELNNPPIITSTPVTSVNESANYSYQVVATDADNDALTYSITENLGWLSISSSGLITGTAPSVNSDTNYAVTVQVSDGIATTTQNYVLTVVDVPEPNNPPVANNQSITTNQDTPMTITLSATDVDGDSFTFSLLTTPSNGVLSGFNSTTGQVTYTPNTSFTGSDNFTFKANDGIADSNNATISIAVNPVIPTNNPPIITSMPITEINESEAYSYQVTATDSDNDTLAYSFSGPSWLTMDSATGLLSGTAPSVTADTNFNITITVSDGADTATQTYMLNVLDVISSPTNNPPVITSMPVTEVNENRGYLYQVTATDEDGDTLTYSLTQAPNWLSINSNTGLITGTAPEVDLDTNYDVTIEVSDGNDSVTQNYFIVVKEIPSLESKTKNKGMMVLPADEFYEQKYLEQFNAPKIAIYNIPATNVSIVSSSKNKLETTEKTLTKSIMPILIILNLTISIILTIKLTRKNIIGGNLEGRYFV
ncbi:MAG: putative Ig domain-containing protein [Nanoarchaeota archaeon]